MSWFGEKKSFLNSLWLTVNRSFKDFHSFNGHFCDHKSQTNNWITMAKVHVKRMSATRWVHSLKMKPTNGWIYLDVVQLYSHKKYRQIKELLLLSIHYKQTHSDIDPVFFFEKTLLHMHFTNKRTRVSFVVALNFRFVVVDFWFYASVSAWSCLIVCCEIWLTTCEFGLPTSKSQSHVLNHTSQFQLVQNYCLLNWSRF